ncbi:MAG: DUF5522 domain-containing protein [Chryseolinea sp.]
MDKDRKDAEGEREEETEYYYLENGLIVFKAAFLLKRGYCCKRGCRHCPYGFRKDSTQSNEGIKDS